MNFSYQPTSGFSAKLNRIEKLDPPSFERILKVIKRVLENPQIADGRMRGLHHSRYKKYVGRRDYRLIYEWCELCRKTARKIEERCANCHELPDHSVVFFDLYHKNEASNL